VQLWGPRPRPAVPTCLGRCTRRVPRGRRHPRSRST
jgi:hypothetical protein